MKGYFIVAIRNPESSANIQLIGWGGVVDANLAGTVHFNLRKAMGCAGEYSQHQKN